MASRFFSFAGSFLRRPQTCAAIGMAWTTQKLFTQKVECAPGLNKQIYHPYSIFEGSQGESWESEVKQKKKRSWIFYYFFFNTDFGHY